jgi:ATP synthase protein I
MTGGKQLAAGGLQFTAAVVLAVFGGIWLDEKLGTSPWMVVVLVFLGASIGFYSLYRNLMKGQRLGDRRQPGERRGDPQ